MDLGILQTLPLRTRRLFQISEQLGRMCYVLRLMRLLTPCVQQRRMFFCNGAMQLLQNIGNVLRHLFRMQNIFHTDRGGGQGVVDVINRSQIAVRRRDEV